MSGGILSGLLGGMIGGDQAQMGNGLLGNLNGYMRDNAGTLLGFGSGMLAGDNSAAASGALQGMQADQRTRLIQQKRAEEEQQKVALQQAAQKLGIDPILAKANPELIGTVAARRYAPKELSFEQQQYNLLSKPQQEQYRQRKFLGGGGDGPFSGNSVDAQSLNRLVQAGRMTPEQAADIGAGRVVTNPADGSIRFIPGSQLLGGAPQAGGGAAPQGAETQGGAPSSGPGVALTPGAAQKPPTEDQAKSRQLYGRALPQLQIAEQNFDALSNMNERLGSDLPLSGYLTSEQYQRASTAVKDITATYLYNVSGATANPQEVENLASTIMPKPGEKAGTIADKKARLRQMVESIKERAGYAPGQAPGAGGQGAPSAQQAVTVDGYTIRQR